MAKEAEEAAKAWEPVSAEEIQAERAEQLLIELEWAEEGLDEHGRKKTVLKEEIRDLKQQIKTAKRLSVKQRARINTLERKWRRQWVKEYERFREDGKDKGYAAALAWSQITVHCKQAGDDLWEYPPWRSICKEGVESGGVTYTPAKGKKPKAKKKARKKKGKKGA